MIVTRGLGRPGGLIATSGLGRVLVIPDVVVSPSDPGVITWDEQFWLTSDGVTTEPGGILVGSVATGRADTSADSGSVLAVVDSGDLTGSSDSSGAVGISQGRGRATVSAGRGTVSTHADAGRAQGES